ncbi:hypothetical protein FHR72_004546 [Mycolicibacterium iranicum]|uniref:HNH nuclease domain-containing protein n=1 Tax=Mycolicibacterium iranicum TaxID=912594 RepID=A0A839QAB6_MYCIR|nr:HNH endonuclease signature motif containing protein [Mycolicibacterium iranicum]MBB2993039.1 hypothetical protein [Mycolicibacterium iranicum]
MELVSEAVAVIGEQLAVLGKACEELSHRELIGLLAEVTTVLRSVPALEHQILARLQAETEPHRLGESSWKRVLTTALRCSDRDARRRVDRAETLGPRQAISGEPLAPVWEATAAAQAAGVLGEEHVAVIAAFHAALPSWVDVDTRAQADRQLAELGAGLGPEALRAAAQRLAAMIDQDGPEPSESERVGKRGLTVGPQQRDGYSRLSGWLTPEARAMWDAIAAKAAAPGTYRPDADASGPEPGHEPDARTAGQRYHDAFQMLCQSALESGMLGSHNGLPVTVIVSTTLQELQNGAGVAVTGGGSLLPVPDLIRMAARAHHYLYVYDGHTGQSLYLGRAKRLASSAQRLVLHARDRGCTRPGCTAPGYWSQAHHAVTDWTAGGETNIDDLAFACPADHRLLDTTGWTTAKNTANQTEWIPPPDLDWGYRPLAGDGQRRTNSYHHPERYLLERDDEPPEEP